MVLDRISIGTDYWLIAISMAIIAVIAYWGYEYGKRLQKIN